MQSRRHLPQKVIQAVSQPRIRCVFPAGNHGKKIAVIENEFGEVRMSRGSSTQLFMDRASAC